jgi:BASS family bile acid:Na+ symporter
MEALVAASRFVGRTFAVWVIVGGAAGYVAPAGFVPVAPHIFWLLGVVMFGMGLTLALGDFLEVARRPVNVALGVAAQFTLMPGIAFVLTQVIPLPPDVAAGVILVGCCPGGTASNVVTYLAKGDVALSVTMTASSTLLAPLVTPALVWLLARQYLPVNAAAMFLSIAQIVLLPLALGVTAKTLFPKVTERLVAVLPLVSVGGIVLIVAAVVAVNQPTLARSGLLILVVVAVHNAVGLLLGYWAGRALRLSHPQLRALSIEVGMQNSGLGAALAQAHFSPLAAVPSAVFSVWHNISGTLLASYFRRQDLEDAPSEPRGIS